MDVGRMLPREIGERKAREARPKAEQSERWAGWQVGAEGRAPPLVDLSVDESWCFLFKSPTLESEPTRVALTE